MDAPSTSVTLPTPRPTTWRRRSTTPLALLLLLPSLSPVHSAGLLDAPLLADATQLLDGAPGWVATNHLSLSLPATVPGDLITDLEHAGAVSDPLYDTNFKSTLWDDTPWTYTLNFTTSPSVWATPHRWLVFDSVKMGAHITLNGVYLGAAADQFLRFRFDVSALLLPPPRTNQLDVTFPPSNDTINAEARWMACSGAWDWAPYSSTYSPTKSHTFTKGIVRSVYVVGVASAALEHLQPRVYYTGAYPTSPLTDATAGGWRVVVVVHLFAPGAAGAQGSLSLNGDWPGSASNSTPVSLVQGNNSVELTLTVPAGAVSLWWPAGVGAQSLYNLSATWTPRGGGAPPITLQRRIGFRYFALVTGNDTDPSTLAGQDGSGGFTMRFNVNGAKIWSRGANLIPMDEMDGRLSSAAYVAMLRSAAAANFNTLRVWGGGMYYHDVVYDTADSLGLILYHDMMFGQPWFGGNSGVPTQNAMQDAEMRYQLRRLSHHPSIVMWDACNECGAKGLWASFVAPTVADEEPSRPLWPACPSSGFAHGVDRLTGLPNGNPLVVKSVGAQQVLRHAPPIGRGGGGPPGCTPFSGVDYAQGSLWVDAPAVTPDDCCTACTAQPGCLAGVLYEGVCYMKNATMVAKPSWSQGAVSVWVGEGPPVTPPAAGQCNGQLTLETHGYYQHGEGFATVNSGADLQPFSPNVPPALDPPFDLGVHCPGTYASEFGASAWSSFESVSPTLPPGDWNLHSPPMFERNYAADNFLTAYFGVPWPGFIDGSSLQAQLYLALVAQGLLVKSDISTRRARNSWGTIPWQLNEIWPTGGWGSLEYGTVGYTPGQVIGGRWKPLHHWFEQHLFTDLFVVCGADGRCLVKNDSPLASFTGTCVLILLDVARSTVVPLARTAVALPVGGGAAAWHCAGSAPNGDCIGWVDLLTPLGLSPSTAILLTHLEDGSGATVYSSFELLAPPSSLLPVLPPTPKIAAVVGTPAPDGASVPVTVNASGFALFVGLTTAAQGRFSENWFILPGGGERVVQFLPFGELDVGVLSKTLRVESVRGYV